MNWALMILLGMVVQKKRKRKCESVCHRERGRKKRMKMPSVMGYLHTSLIQEWGAYPVNGKIWCTLGHHGRIVLQQLFCCRSCLVELQSCKLHSVNLNAMKTVCLFHSLCYAQEDLILTQAFQCCIREKLLQLQVHFKEEHSDKLQYNCHLVL